MKVEIKIDKKVSETTVVIIANELTNEVIELQETLLNTKPNIISGFSDYKLEIIKEENIVRIFADQGKVYIVTKDKEFTSKLTLNELENRLNKSYFLRISRGDIINLNKVKSFDLSFVGTIYVEMLNGDVLYVSRRKLKDVKNYLGI
ncbi:MAG: LytTR family transcriptional regulator [Acholeplasmataceae bacterium]|nr:LytTR family transcriptional regulator [Acholeplasmataceae bacterium]